MVNDKAVAEPSALEVGFCKDLKVRHRTIPLREESCFRASISGPF